MKFMKEDLLAVTDCVGNESYIDLKVNRTYREKPVVLSFGCMELPYGGVELLKVGAFFSAVPENRMSPCAGWIRTASTFMILSEDTGLPCSEGLPTGGSCLDYLV